MKLGRRAEKDIQAVEEGVHNMTSVSGTRFK